MGVANNSAYLAWFEVGRVEYLRELGHSYAEVHDGGEEEHAGLFDVLGREEDVEPLPFEELVLAPSRQELDRPVDAFDPALGVNDEE